MQNCQSGQKFLLTVVGGKRLVGCGQISLASNSKANGLNEAIPSQVVHIVVLNKLILLKDVKKLIALPSKAINRVLHNGWSYGVGPKVNMRLFWIANDYSF